MVAVGDIVYQVKHGRNEGRYFRVLEDRGTTVLAQPLDRETREEVGPTIELNASPESIEKV